MNSVISRMLFVSIILIASPGGTGSGNINPEPGLVVVNTFSDDVVENGNCTLREAILAANSNTAVDACAAGSGADTIVLGEGVYAISIAGDNEDGNLTGDFDISGDLTIAGVSANKTIIDASGLDRAFDITSASEVELINMTIQNGHGGDSAGGINNLGKLTIYHTKILNNQAEFSGGGIRNEGSLAIFESTIGGNRLNVGHGGGIDNQGSLVVERSLVANNSSYGNGGIYNTGTMTMTNVTISGNYAAFSGGITSDGSAVLTNVTISQNTAVESSSTGGIDGNASLRNSIVANNPGGNCSSQITSLGYNLDSGESCGFNNTGDLTNLDPRLGSLTDNSGASLTHALLSGSPAIDTGSCSDSEGKAILTDQRGAARPQGSGCDIGAFEGTWYSLSLPAVRRPSPAPLVELDVTSRGEIIGYPTFWWVYGHVNNLINTEVYSVTIGIDVTYYPYCDPDPCDPYEKTEVVGPAFSTTLPGQPNPFKWTLYLGKAYAYVGQVRILNSSLVGGGSKTHHPLGILNWEQDGNTVVGNVRNDSGKTLENSRVVVFSKECSWRSAVLTKTTLQPGEESNFHLDYFGCTGDDVIVIGQGTAVP